MKKNIILLGSLLFSVIAFSQVGINTESPKATMDVSAKRDSGGTITDNSQTLGLQAPRLTRAELTANTAAYGTDQRGALIYITDVSGGNTTSPRTNITTVGYYYFDGSLWQKITNGTGGTYSGSASVPLVGGNTFQRAALTGDVTAAQNINATTISNGAVTNSKIADNAVSTSKIANLAVTPAKIEGGFVTGQILSTNASGLAQWISSPAATLGTQFGGNFTDVTSFDDTNPQYKSMGSIFLPQGKWIVSWVLQLGLQGTPVAGTPAGTDVFPRNFHVLSELSSSTNALLYNGFTLTNGLNGSGRFGTLTGNAINAVQPYLGQLRGTSFVTVNATNGMTLYIISRGIDSGTLRGSNVKFQASYGENAIYAVPAN